MSNYVFQVDLTQYLPYWFREIADYQAIMEAEENQWSGLETAVGGVYNNFYFQTMDAPTVTAWEQVIGILASPSTESLDFRRARLINRLSTRPPFTLQFLYDKLDELIGPGKWSCEIDYPNYAIIIGASAQDVNWQGEIMVTLNTIKPCHMIFTTRPEVWSPLQLDETVDLIELTYNYRMGAWGLGLKPFADEENLGVIVTANQETVNQNLLNQTAQFVVDDVATARINGTVSITSLTKAASGSTATITYTVTQEQAATITQLELLDADGNVLTSAPVYVPVIGDATFKHTIPVTEGGTN